MLPAFIFVLPLPTETSGPCCAISSQRQTIAGSSGLSSKIVGIVSRMYCLSRSGFESISACKSTQSFGRPKINLKTAIASAESTEREVPSTFTLRARFEGLLGKYSALSSCEKFSGVSDFCPLAVVGPNASILVPFHQKRIMGPSHGMAVDFKTTPYSSVLAHALRLL
ncbi:hypothetical protein BDZ88DRAFT_10742 [Geranomyces variabilis]|nr:hypothetical protein BDZ88DRAFT_10742 [Geranomyces variabilis]